MGDLPPEGQGGTILPAKHTNSSEDLTSWWNITVKVEEEL